MKQLILTFLVASILSGCDGTTWWPDIDSEERCKAGQGLSKTDLQLLYESEGHISTTHIVANIAGQGEMAEKYALYSQAPDTQAVRFSSPWVSFWAIVPWELDYRHLINADLHSFHGGDDSQVKERRKALEALIHALAKENPKDNAWKIGFLIHALGDSFAHVYDLEDGKGQHAYQEWIGHVPEKGAYSPDSIHEHIEDYIAFVNALYRALNMGDGNNQKLAGYIAHIRKAKEDAEKESDPDKYIESAIVRYDTEDLELHYCEHKKWASVLSKSNVQTFLEKIDKELNNI